LVEQEEGKRRRWDRVVHERKLAFAEAVRAAGIFGRGGSTPWRKSQTNPWSIRRRARRGFGSSTTGQTWEYPLSDRRLWHAP